jgi:hypothetical protein
VLRTGNHGFVILLAEHVLRTRIGSARPWSSSSTVSWPRSRLFPGQYDDSEGAPGIIPVSAGLCAHTQTAFGVFDDALVRVENLTAALDISHPQEVALYLTVFEQMRLAAIFSAAAREVIPQICDKLLQ